MKGRTMPCQDFMKPQVDLILFIFLEEIEDTKKTVRNYLTFTQRYWEFHPSITFPGKFRFLAHYDRNFQILPKNLKYTLCCIKVSMILYVNCDDTYVIVNLLI